MTAPNPPSEAQGQQAQAPAQAPAAAQRPPAPDRTLSVEETQNLLRGYALDEPPTTGEREQSNMVADWLRGPLPGSEPPPQQQQAQPPQQVAPQPPQVQQPQAPQAAPPGPPPSPDARFLDQALAAATAAAQRPQQPQQVPGAPQQVPVQPQDSPELAAMRAELELMRVQNQALHQRVASIQQPQPQAQQQPQRQQQPQPQDAPTPQFSVPDSYMAALASEDVNVRRSALDAMLNGVAAAVLNQARQETQVAQQQMIHQVQPVVDRSLRDFRIQQDMYGTYPELAAFRGYVEAAARQLEPQFSHIGWGPDYRDAIAERVAPLVPGVFQKIQANRAQRVGQAQLPQTVYQPTQTVYQPTQTMVPPQVTPQPQPYTGAPLPQYPPQALPPGVSPVGIAGAAHGQPVPQGQQPVLARDAGGNYYPVPAPPQPYLGGPQVRPDGSQVDPQLLDIWQTLGYAS